MLRFTTNFDSPFNKGLASHCTSCRRFDQNSTFELASHAFHQSWVIGPRRSVEPFILVVRSDALEQTGLVPLLDCRCADREPLCHLAEAEKPASTQPLGVARKMLMRRSLSTIRAVKGFPGREWWPAD